MLCLKTWKSRKTSHLRQLLVFLVMDILQTPYFPTNFFEDCDTQCILQPCDFFFFFFGSACTYIFRGTTANFHSWCEWAHMSGRVRIWYFLSLQLLFSTSLSKNADRHEHFQRHYRLLGCIFTMHYLQSLLHSCFQAGYCKGR